MSTINQADQPTDGHSLDPTGPYLTNPGAARVPPMPHEQFTRWLNERLAFQQTQVREHCDAVHAIGRHGIELSKDRPVVALLFRELISLGGHQAADSNVARLTSSHLVSRLDAYHADGMAMADKLAKAERTAGAPLLHELEERYRDAHADLRATRTLLDEALFIFGGKESAFTAVQRQHIARLRTRCGMLHARLTAAAKEARKIGARLGGDPDDLPQDPSPLPERYLARKARASTTKKPRATARKGEPL